MPSYDQTKQITSVKSFINEIMRLKNDVLSSNVEQWFFRGQKNVAWDVRPNIFRDDNLALEHIVIERALCQNPVEFRECSNNFEILTKLQHYGLGTRLLDVTLNPLVALFFATEPSYEYTKNGKNQYILREHDGIVYYSFVSSCALRDLGIRIALAIPFIEVGKSLSLEKFCKKLVDDNIITNSEYKDLIDEDYLKIIRILQTNSFIIATNSNVRLIQQRGAFLLSPSINVKTEEKIESSILSKAKMDLRGEFKGSIVIPATDKDRVREELDFFNINKATLFPELEHQMHYIQTQTRPSIGVVEEFTQYTRKIKDEKPVPTDISSADIEKILDKALPEVSDDVKLTLINTLNKETQIIDWQKKDSIISRIRRAITRSLGEIYSAVNAKSKADEIMKKILGMEKQ